MNMKFYVLPVIFFTFFHLSQAGPLRLQKRAAFYIANETACVVDNTVYNSGDPIPTDDPCEACRCRPPGFACVLKECESKPGCRAVRRTGQCCPEYDCGCEHNGRMYRDGDEIRDSQNPCYTCHCQGSSIACAFVDCFFRVDCAPEYVPGECCPHYNHCNTLEPENSTNVDYAFSSEKAHNSDETTEKPRTSESTLYSETPESIVDEQVTKKENDNESSEKSPPESLDSSLLFSINEREDTNKNVHTTEKVTSTESISDPDSGETSQDAEINEENSSEKQVESATELLKNDFEIMNDEEKSEVNQEHGSPKVDPDNSAATDKKEQDHPKVSVDPDNSGATDKNVEIYPVEESTTAEVKFKTAPPTEVTGQTTVSSTTIIPEAFEDIDDKSNELIKRFRSLKNLTADDITKPSNETIEVISDESSTKEVTEKMATSTVTEKSATVTLDKEIVVEDVKSSHATTAVPETVYHNSDAKIASESVETVTTVVEVKEATSSEKAGDETPSPTVANQAEQVLFKALSDGPETNNNHQTTIKSSEVTTRPTTVEISDSTTTKIADVSIFSSVQPETSKPEEKISLYSDDTKILVSTEAPKVTEVESSTSVVTEINSEKEESSKD